MRVQLLSCEMCACAGVSLCNIDVNVQRSWCEMCSCAGVGV